MLYYNSGLVGLPVREARSGDTVAIVEKLIVDPRSFTLAALQLKTLDKESHYIVTDSIAEISLQHGLFFSDTDAISKISDLPRLAEVLDLGFELIKLPVRTSSDKKIKSHKLGTVEDFVVDDTSFAVFQIIVKRGLLSSFMPELAINRQQVLEITNRGLIVDDAYAKSAVAATASRASE
ncbi:hypothetical protein FWG76_00855 [Candidatus Saccharibacteria bacterium]|nr:hypothetical protein [Candidatus Saccharibacteria bacterium]